MESNDAPFEAEVDHEGDLLRQEDLDEQGRSSSLDRKGANVNGESEDSPLLPRATAQDSSPSDAPGQFQDPWAQTPDAEQLPWYKRASIFWLLPAFMPFCLAFGGTIVPKVNLILTLICQDYLSERSMKDPTFTFMPALLGEENPQCRIPEVQALVAKFQLYINLVSGIFAALVTPHFGALSDRIGRKKVITFCAFGVFASEIVFVIVGSNPDTVSVYWLLLGSLFDGICGSFTASMAVSYSYAADCTPPDRRNVAFGYFHGTLFTGIAFGPVLAGYLIEWYGNILVIFYVSICCHLFFITFLNLFIPESLSKERQLHAKDLHRKKMLERDTSTWRGFFLNYNIFEPLGILWPTGEGTSPVIRRNMVFLAAIDTIIFGAAMGTMNIIIIYAEYVFGWSNLQSSQFLSLVNIARVLGLLIFLPTITRFVRGTTRPNLGHQGADKLDLYLVRIAVFVDLLGYIGYSVAPVGWFMVVSGMVASLGGVGPPTLQAALTKHVPVDRTGRLLGAMGLLHALARVVAPTIFNLIYARTVGSFTPTVFICLASTFVVAECLSWFLKPGVHLPADYHPPALNPSDRDRRHFVVRAGSIAVQSIERLGGAITRRRSNRDGEYESLPRPSSSSSSHHA